MKSIAAGLLTHYGQDATTIAHALRITRPDGEVFAFTSHDKEATISSVTYSPDQGLLVSDIVISSGLAVGNMELTTLNDGTLFETKDILNGIWRNSDFTLFAYNHQNVSDGIDTKLTGTLGEVEIRNNALVIELRDLRQYLQQPIGSPSTKNCRYRFGDMNTCKVDLHASPGLTFTGTVTFADAGARQVFKDSSKTQSEHFFTEGEMQWLTGENAGTRCKVKTFTFGVSSPSEKEFTLALPVYGDIAVGDTYQVSKGCRKRLEDCIENNNVLNFGGEPHRPGIDALLQPVTPSV